MMPRWCGKASYGGGVLWAWWLLVLLSSLAYAQAMFQPEVRVWLTRWQSTPLCISCPSPWRVTGAGRTWNLPAGERVTVEREGTQLTLRIGDRQWRASEWTIEGEAPLSLTTDTNMQSYRGKLMLRLYRDRLQVVNVLPLEEYLLGVVPLEMPSRFPAEALRAQAIAARSWSVRNRGKHEADGADYCDTTHCQVYAGVLAERESTTQAVRDTAGLILVNAGAPVDGVYTADCGGQPALENRTDAPPSDRNESGEDYCAANPRHRWTLRVPLLQVWQLAGGKDSLQESPNGNVEVLTAQRDASGRVVTLRLRWGEQAVEVAGARLRQALSLPSTLFEVWVEGVNLLVFEGRGAGHGRGLCQWGAAGRARAGQKAEQILQFYYPGAQIVPLSEAMWRWREEQKGSSVR